MAVVQYGCGLFDLGTLKSALSQEWIDDMSWFFPCWYKFREAKSYCDNYLVGLAKKGWDLMDRATLNSGISHKWFNDLSRLIEWFLHFDSDLISFGVTTSPFCIFDI